MLELKVDFLNINSGYNQELKDACESLREYCYFVEKVRKFGGQKDSSLKEAVNRAVEECITEGILRDFLIAHREEVVTMSILEFTFEDWLKMMEEEKEEVAEGWAEIEKSREEVEKSQEELRKDRAELRLQETHLKEKMLNALVASLTPILHDFETVYQAVTANEEYKDYTRQQIEKYYHK